MTNKNRPNQEQREAVAQDIREGGEAAVETELEEIGLTDGDTPILDEAKAERAEGGGPIADAVDEMDAKADSDEIEENA